MKGFLHLIVPPTDFTLERGEGVLTSYRFNTGVADHRFCRICGVQPFYRPRSHPEDVSVNARCLDGDALARFTEVPFDGQNWEANVKRIQ